MSDATILSDITRIFRELKAHEELLPKPIQWVVVSRVDNPIVMTIKRERLRRLNYQSGRMVRWWL